MITATKTITVDDLPGLNCGLCGLRTCHDMADRLVTQPEFIERCIHLSNNRISVAMPVVPRRRSQRVRRSPLRHK